MKHMLSIVLAVLMLTACQRSFDVTKVRRGMSAAEVVAAIGEPDEKQDMPMGLQFWKYGNNAMIIVSQDSVLSFTNNTKDTVALMLKRMQDGLAGMDARLESMRSNPPSEFSKLSVGMTLQGIGVIIPDANASDAVRLESGETWVPYKDWFIELDSTLHVTRWMYGGDAVDSLNAIVRK